MLYIYIIYVMFMFVYTISENVETKLLFARNK